MITKESMDWIKKNNRMEVDCAVSAVEKYKSVNVWYLVPGRGTIDEWEDLGWFTPSEIKEKVLDFAGANDEPHEEFGFVWEDQIEGYKIEEKENGEVWLSFKTTW